MARNFFTLRPYGSGYELVPTERTDAPMFTVRVFPGVIHTDYAVEFTVEVADYVAFIVGTNFDAEEDVSNVSMIVGYDDFWALTWDVSNPLGSNAYFDVLFVSRGLCTEVDQDIILPLEP